MPNSITVVNSTPLIVMSNIGRLDILQQLYGSIVIPEAVRDEVSIKDPTLIARQDWIEIVPIKNQAAKEAFASVLHIGEVEVMILAKEIQAALVILDDGLARKHAKYLKLNLTGTIGVLLKAKKEKIIEHLKPLLDEIIRNGFYLSDNIYQEVMILADE